MHDIISIGSATRDNFLMSDFKMIDWPETPSKKAIALPWGEKIGINKAHFTIGGNAANASVTFARQGFQSSCVAHIGKDLSGKEFLQYLKKEGVNTKLISKDKTLSTAYSVLLLDEKVGERTILSYHGASNAFNLSKAKRQKLSAKWWYLSLSGESDKMFPKLIQFAKENNIKVAFNPSGHHLKFRKKEILDALKDIAFLVLNEGEAAELVGIPFEQEKEVFKKLDELMPGIVAVTDGSNGATVSDGKNIYRCGIFPNEKVVDRTGAGDAFGSGFVAGLMHWEFSNSSLSTSGYPLVAIQDAIRLASANAASVVEKIGATEGVLTKHEFETNPRWQKFEIQVENL